MSQYTLECIYNGNNDNNETLPIVRIIVKSKNGDNLCVFDVYDNSCFHKSISDDYFNLSFNDTNGEMDLFLTKNYFELTLSTYGGYFSGNMTTKYYIDNDTFNQFYNELETLSKEFEKI